ncbi:MAG: glycosyltransferase [Propionibacteriaceae bacterium]|nr:glycosyltransferase [Propionibacteriaceae bacterium]
MSLDMHTTLDALEVVRCAPTLLAGLAAMEALEQAARVDGPEAADLLASAIEASGDDLTAIAAVHAASAAGSATANQLLVPLLASGVPYLREHAAWALASAPPVTQAVPALRGLAAAGGFTGTLAEATLESWGLLTDDTCDDHANLPVEPRPSGESGFTVAQLYLHADIDGTLSAAGQGDTGGIATLLVQLGDALLDEGTVERVLTLSRGRPGRMDVPRDLANAGHHYVSVPLPGPVRQAPDAWPLHLAARQGLRRILKAAGRVDVLHLRMADVGAWAAAEVARDLGITTVLTLAPDPHALIAAREAAGTLSRDNFGSADHLEHLVFRFRLLRDLAAQASHLVVFPRPNLAQDLRNLLQLDPDDEHRLSAVPEGINLAPLDRAAEEVPAALRGDRVTADTASALAELDALLDGLPPGRRALPLAITVGRLHRVKGMATFVEAWASDPALADRCNLLIVGGDLHHASDDENQQLALIDATVPRADGPGRGLLLAGHRPNGVVAVWLAAARHGRPGLAAPAGVYVSASLKEEFGIAILEAMASGLVVVAPRDGGPATYVEHGVTGVLTDTSSLDTLGAALASALDLASAPGATDHANRARALVTERFSIQTMASALAAIYTKVTHDTARHQS